MSYLDNLASEVGLDDWEDHKNEFLDFSYIGRGTKNEQEVGWAAVQVKDFEEAKEIMEEVLEDEQEKDAFHDFLEEVYAPFDRSHQDDYDQDGDVDVDDAFMYDELLDHYVDNPGSTHPVVSPQGFVFNKGYSYQSNCDGTFTFAPYEDGIIREFTASNLTIRPPPSAEGTANGRTSGCDNDWMYSLEDGLWFENRGGKWETDVKELTTSSLSNKASQVGIQYNTTVELNRIIGRNFQETILAATGMRENTTRKSSEDREDAYGPPTTVPDMVGDAIDSEGRVYNNSTFFEVKAVKRSISLGYSQGQVLGMLDHLQKQSAAGLADAIPSLVFITTGNTKIGKSVINEANERKVAVYQVKVYIDEDEIVTLGDAVLKTNHLIEGDTQDNLMQPIIPASIMFPGLKKVNCQMVQNPSQDSTGDPDPEALELGENE